MLGWLEDNILLGGFRHGQQTRQGRDQRAPVSGATVTRVT